MIDPKIVEEIVKEGIQETALFVVDITVTPDNRIVVEIDNDEGVDIDRCMSLHHFIESRLDRDVEDYELEVGSAGITSPFKVVRQYQKNIGNEVEVLTRTGVKHNGILKAADDKAFSLTVTKKVKPEGAKRKIEVEDKFIVTITKKVKTETSKRKVEVSEDLAFGYDEIKYTKYLIRFK